MAEKKNESYIVKLFKDVEKSSKTNKILIGATTGWCTGFLGMKIGKITAICVGGGIIFLQIAHQNGYISINYNKVKDKIDKITDEVEEKITGQGPHWMDKVERFVDKKVNEAEDVLKKKQKKTKRWYDKMRGKSQDLIEFNTFLISFVCGVALGVMTGQ